MTYEHDNNLYLCHGVWQSATDSDFLEHYGIPGMKWGIRRFQNEDGTLTQAGKIRYGSDGQKSGHQVSNALNSNVKKKNILQKIRENARSMYLPPEMVNASKEKQKAWAEKEKKKFIDESNEEKRIRDLGKRQKSFNKISTEDQFKMLKDTQKFAFELIKKGGHDNETMADGLLNWYDQNVDKTARALFNEYMALHKGSERDRKLTELLKDSYDQGEDSPFLYSLHDYMSKTHGELMYGRIRSATGKELMKLANEATDQVEKRSAELRRQVNKSGDVGGRKDFEKYKNLSQNDSIYQKAMANQESAWNKYYAQVLKDMNLPVNEKTIKYIQAVIYYE